MSYQEGVSVCNAAEAPTIQQKDDDLKCLHQELSRKNIEIGQPGSEG